MRPAARAAARYLKHAPDRLGHPIRRAAALREIGSLQQLASVLFVCHGNICRSPYAARSFERLLPAALREAVRIGSAGFIGPNRPAPLEARTAAAKLNVDLRPHRSAALAQNIVGSADLIVVMEASQRRDLLRHFWIQGRIVVLGDVDPLPIAERAISDPYGDTEDVFEETYRRIDRCLDALIAALPDHLIRVETGRPQPPGSFIT